MVAEPAASEVGKPLSAEPQSLGQTLCWFAVFASMKTLWAPARFVVAPAVQLPPV
jgi:hypothetical protein